MSCAAGKTFGSSAHTCSCRAEAGHETAHDCRCGRSWWNHGAAPTTAPGEVSVDGYAYVEGKGYVPHGKAHVYAALGKQVDWGMYAQAATKDLRVLGYKDN